MATIARLVTMIEAQVRGFEQAQASIERIDRGFQSMTRSSQKLDVVAAGMSKVGKAAWESAQATDRMIAGMSEAGRAAAAAAPKALTFSGAITGLVGLVGGVQLLNTAMNMAAQAVGAMVQQGVQLGPVSDSFNRLTKSIGESADVMLSTQRTATKGLISDLDLMQSTNKAILLGLPVTSEEMAKLAKTAITLGRAMGQDATKSLDDLITALGRSSPMILDNLGLTVKLGEANDKYAASLGKTADDLTDQERKMAFYKAALEAAEKKLADLGDVQLTTADQFSRVTTLLSNVGAGMVDTANKTSLLSRAFGFLGDAIAGITFQNKGPSLPNVSPIPSHGGGPLGAIQMMASHGGDTITGPEGLPAVTGALSDLDKAYLKLNSDIENERGLFLMNLDAQLLNASLSEATRKLREMAMNIGPLGVMQSGRINPALAMLATPGGGMPYGGNLFTFGSGVPLLGQGGGGGSFFGNLFGGLGGSLKNIWKGMSGGGGMAGLFSNLGSGLMSGGLSTLMNVGVSMIGKGIGALVGHFTQGKQTNNLRDQLFGQMGGFDNVAKAAAEAGFSMDRLLKPSKVKDMQAAWTDFNAALQKHKELADTISQLTDAHAQRQQMLQDALSRYNFTATEKGPLINMQEMAAQAEQLLTDYKLLTEAGVDQNAILREMGGSMSDFVNRAIKTGTEIPEAMREIIQKMIDQGELLDENGVAFKNLEDTGLKFGKSLTEMFKGVLEKLDEMIAKLEEAARLGHGLPASLPAPVQPPPEDVVPMAAGGMGVVTKPTLFLAGENGAESFAFSGSGRRFGGGGAIVSAIERLGRRMDRQAALMPLLARDAAMKALA